MPGDAQGLDEKQFTRTQAWELCLVALCVWREARNQPFEGKLAVAWSIRNRVAKKSWMGKDWEEVVLKKWQYSSFNPNDPNAVLLPGDPVNDKAWADSLVCAERAYLGIGVDPSLGSTHYHTKSIHPAWVDDKATVFKVEIGDHRFYVAN